MTLPSSASASPPLPYTLEPGWTYWLHTASGEHVRFDFTEDDLQVPLPTRADDSTAGGWSRVAGEVVVTRGVPLTLRVAGSNGKFREWVGGAVSRLDRSSKERLPTSVW